MNLITEDKIIETAEALAAAGKNPTQVTVREALGGGSFATIGPILKEWKESKKEDHALTEIQVPEAIIERLEQLQGAVWQAAVDEAERRLNAEREALKTAQDAAAAEVSEQLESVAMLETEARKYSETIEVLSADVDTRTAQLQQLSTELKEVTERARDDARTSSETLVKEVSRAEAAIARAGRAEALHDTAKTQARADLAELRKEHKADLAAMKQDVKDVKTAATDQLKQAESKTQEQAERADKAEKAAQVSAAGEQACQSRLEAAQLEAEQTQKRITKLEEKADRATQEAAELRGELNAIKDANNTKVDTDSAKKSGA